MFNALRYREELEEAGFTREQAEVSVRVLIDVMNENFATKSDIKELELKLTSRMDLMEQKLGSVFKELEYKLTIKLGVMLGGMLTLGLGLTATIVKLLQTPH